MTVNELIEILEELRDEDGGETEVRIMTQANWPFENSIAGVTNTESINNEIEDNAEYDEDEEDDDEDEAHPPHYIYIVEGDQLCYGSKAAWDCLRTI